MTVGAANCAEINKLQSGQSKKRKLSDGLSFHFVLQSLCSHDRWMRTVPKSSEVDSSKKAPAPAAGNSNNNASAPSPAASEKPLPKKAKTQSTKDATNKVKKTKCMFIVASFLSFTFTYSG